jgi:hypothetical protein
VGSDIPIHPAENTVQYRVNLRPVIELAQDDECDGQPSRHIPDKFQGKS